MVRVLNSQFNKIDSELSLKTQESLIHFKLQKMNSTYIRYLIEKQSFEI